MDGRQVLYDYAMRLVGLPYKWGGDNPLEGMDCSGLVIELLKAAGVLTGVYDTTAKELRKFLLSFSPTPPQAPLFGAVVFFGTSADAISHVGFCLNSKQMIEAGGGGASVVDVKTAAEKGAFVRVRPISHRKDVFDFILPQYNWGQ